ncbi:hypothetical protein ACFQFH_20085 [Halobaculum halobium]|uniref:Uncharacterized protein n=1 Tax=Halobaculum halobium TaxID=3032281 RepID=A0ABD5TEY7_9EURY|nr:hypothetical protein [Halobaculum sp. SYNS20]
MADESAVRSRLKSASINRDEFTKASFDFTAGTPGERTEVASVQVNRAHMLRETNATEYAIMAYQEFTTDGTADNQETFNLSHDLIDSGAVDTSLLLYEGGSVVQPDSVDYDANTFDYTSGGTDTTLGVYYAAGDQAQLELVKEAPNGTKETVDSRLINKLHLRDNAKEPVNLSLGRSYWQRYVPTDWTLSLYVDAPYTAAFMQDVDGDGEPEPAANALLSIPYSAATGSIEGLGAVVRMDAARR